jgi:hypothetical protein
MTPMSICNLRFSTIVALMLAGAACGRDASSTTAPSQLAAMTVTAITPTVGSTGGDTTVTMTGTGFQPDMTVAFDGTMITGRFDSRDRLLTTLFLQTPPHTTGAVDILISSPRTAALRLTSAYTYAAPGSFDFNGSWSAFSFDGSDRTLRFTIQNDRLVSTTCLGASGEVIPLALPTPPPIIDGAFSISGNDGVGISGRMVSASAAVGTMNLAPCGAMQWRTYPRP